jgi:fused signal recognition particle receptor
MGFEIVLVVAVVLVLLVTGAVVTTRIRSRGGPELEPPPARRGPSIESSSEPVSDAQVLEGEEVGLPDPSAAAETDAELELAEVEAGLEDADGAPAAKPRLRDRLFRARNLFSDYVASVLSRSKIDQDTWDELEEALIRADVGVGQAAMLLDAVRDRVKIEAISEPQQLLDVLKQEMKARLVADRTLQFVPDQPNVWLFVGVNGVGKTTTIGKLGKQQRAEGRSVVMAAGDTFRAAAAEQLTLWAERVGAEIVRGNEGGDPSSVIFDAVQRAGARGYDLVLADTAGRLHTKTNLMEELRKVRRVADKEPGKVTEVLLVLDATTGQNGLQQARQFTEAVEVTGVVLTKLDGSAKGGIVYAIQAELGIPVKLVGVGETADDLVVFDENEFVDALFD